MQSKVSITDERLLRSKLQEYKVKFDGDSNSLCWVFDLLRSGSQSITDPGDFGFDLINDSVRNLSELKKVMEEELFQLSEAHYQRYFKTENFFNA
jgi:hypothetical protein